MYCNCFHFIEEKSKKLGEFSGFTQSWIQSQALWIYVLLPWHLTYFQYLMVH